MKRRTANKPVRPRTRGKARPRSHLAADDVNLTTHVNDIVNEIKWKDLRRVALVGHSYGGLSVCPM